MLEIKLFGTGQAYYNDQPLAGFPNQQPCLLLSYLLLNKNYPHNREHLAAILWDDAPAIIGRKSLRNALWRLRQIFESVGACLDDYLMITEDSVAFINTSHFGLDIETFETTTALCKDLSGWELSEEQVSQLETGVDLYLGDLLEGIYEDWVLYDRERLNLVYINTLNKLMVYYGLKGNYERGLTCGNRILAMDNTRETVYRQMMWLYCLLGDRNAALKLYKCCSRILRDELGVDPMQETRHLFEQVLHNQIDPKEWQFPFDAPAYSRRTVDRDSQSLTENTLKKLRFIQNSIEETNAQLHLLEKMLGETLTQLSRA